MTTTMTTTNGHHSRKRRGSVAQTVDKIVDDPNHHLTGALTKPPNKSASLTTSRGFWSDIITMRWMYVPSSSAKLLAIPIALFFNWSLITPNHDNPFAHLLFITGKLSDSPAHSPLYGKSYWDIGFILYYVIFWSFVRQTIILHFLYPIARHFGIRKQAKLDRFGEQGYAVIYFSVMGTIGLYTMYYQSPTWYFKTEHFWIDYPHWRMPGLLKTYYLLQFSYWCQQFIIISLRMEKPRKDFAELFAHHVVTLWLVGWSYLVNLTRIGNAVFLTMDWSDVFISLAKCFNYLHMEKTKTVAFAWFAVVWTYLRHYLNLKILYSVYYEFDLIPEKSKQWAPETGAWLVPWMKWQIFAPLLLLQIINLFWYFLIWRILLRAIFSSHLDDERSDDEGDDNNESKEE